MPATASRVHPSHALAREQMAQEIADAVWACLQPSQRRSHVTVRRLAGWGPEARLAAARATGRDRIPSAETWGRACDLLGRRIRAERGERL